MGWMIRLDLMCPKITSGSDVYFGMVFLFYGWMPLLMPTKGFVCITCTIKIVIQFARLPTLGGGGGSFMLGN